MKITKHLLKQLIKEELDLARAFPMDGPQAASRRHDNIRAQELTGQEELEGKEGLFGDLSDSYETVFGSDEERAAELALWQAQKDAKEREAAPEAIDDGKLTYGALKSLVKEAFMTEQFPARASDMFDKMGKTGKMHKMGKMDKMDDMFKSTPPPPECKDKPQTRQDAHHMARAAIAAQEEALKQQRALPLRERDASVIVDAMKPFCVDKVKPLGRRHEVTFFNGETIIF
tara:strand:+ start:72 stop:761 length:690 start_codon:yes stop_codon:yes gene_type:complete